MWRYPIVELRPDQTENVWACRMLRSKGDEHLVPGDLGTARLWQYGRYDTGARMKTTVEIPDSLAEEAKAIAQRENTTLRALIETGLRQVLRDRQSRRRFELRDASFGGRGLQPEFRDGDWRNIRDAAYEGRGS